MNIRQPGQVKPRRKSSSFPEASWAPREPTGSDFAGRGKWTLCLFVDIAANSSAAAQAATTAAALLSWRCTSLGLPLRVPGLRQAAVLEDHRLWGCTRRVDCRPAGEGEGEECHETGAASRTVRPGLRWQVRQWHLHPLITAFDSSVLLSWMNSETSNRIVGNLAIIYPSFNFPQCEMHKSGHGILVNKHELLLKWKNNMQRKWESQISSAEIYYYNNRIKVLKFGAWWLKAFLAGV